MLLREQANLAAAVTRFPKGSSKGGQFAPGKGGGGSFSPSSTTGNRGRSTTTNPKNAGSASQGGRVKAKPVERLRDTGAPVKRSKVFLSSKDTPEQIVIGDAALKGGLRFTEARALLNVLQGDNSALTQLKTRGPALGDALLNGGLRPFSAAMTVVEKVDAAAATRAQTSRRA